MLTKSYKYIVSDDEEDNDTEPSLPELIAKNTRLTPKLARLRPRTVGAGAKELLSNSYKSSTSSSSSGTKRKGDETDDNNIRQIPKKKKPKHTIKKHSTLNFFSVKKYLFSHLCNFFLSYEFFL